MARHQSDKNTIHGRSRDMRESQRALELRKFYAPGLSRDAIDTPYNDSLNGDGALDAYAETILWRLKAVHAMVSLVDRGTQYFLAGAVRAKEAQDDHVDDIITTGTWYGCTTVPTSGGLCENTLALDLEKDHYPCFIVNDLTKDERFAHLAVVDGTIARYRFYAGTPIITRHGVSIGSFFLFDDEVRDGLSFNQRRFFHQQAANVMRHLETKREAAERRRAALMSQGIATFLEWTSREDEINTKTCTPFGDSDAVDFNQSEDRIELRLVGEADSTTPTRHHTPEKSSVIDRIRMMLDRAAEILKESLELSVGGVVFLDTAARYTELEGQDAKPAESTDVEKEGQETSPEVFGKTEIHLNSPTEQEVFLRHLSVATTRSSSDKHRPSKVLAISAAETATWDDPTSTNAIDSELLNTLTQSYPKGNVWYIDEEGYFSSLEQITTILEGTAANSPSGRRKSNASSIDVSRQKSEAAILSRIFHKARQIMFIPLWDASIDRWYAGCFVWSQSAVPVFTVDSEMSYLSAFTNSVMVEISRLDAITNNKIKSDFISSISHEFRSPLHGILASADFLRDSELDTSQIEFISTIQNCSGTLLDTINHVLDYSKINSFEKLGNQQAGTISNELYRVTNLALLCEDIVSGMMAAVKFRGTAGDVWTTNINLHNEQSGTTRNGQKPLEIILDMESRDWIYNVQAGALRRVVMNIFGNAQKYTTSGYIMVQLKIKEVVQNDGERSSNNTLVLHIRDSGCGMSTEYMERKLYHPFAQEDSFAPGVGLGLSIVWSIVNQLGGKIAIRSELSKGTDVEITIPVEKVAMTPAADGKLNDSAAVLAEAEECLHLLRKRAAGKSVCFSHSENGPGRYTDSSWRCIEKYCTQWFGLTVQDCPADVVITDEDNYTCARGANRVLLIQDDIGTSKKLDQTPRNHLIGRASHPLGPFKLARSLLALLDQQLPGPCEEKRISWHNASTQTPLGSPEERTIMNGLIMMDYCFPVQNTPATSASTNSDPVGIKPSTEAVFKQNGNANEYMFSNIGANLAAMMLQQPPVRKSPPYSKENSNTTQTQPALPIPLAELPSPTPEPLSTPNTKGLHILAVDDNALNLQLLHRYLLKRSTDTIVTARNGVEAVAAVRNGKRLFDIVFMDISMPEMDGFEATRLIRGIEREGGEGEKHAVLRIGEKRGIEAKEGEGKERSYIVAVTGLASKRDREEAVECGFNDFLTKPVSFKRIGKLLRRLSGE